MASRLNQLVRQPKPIRQACSGRPKWNTDAINPPWTPRHPSAATPASRAVGVPSTSPAFRATAARIPPPHWVSTSIAMRGKWASGGAGGPDTGRDSNPDSGCRERYTVVGTVRAAEGIPGKAQPASPRSVPDASPRHRSVVAFTETRVIRMASLGHACTQAGASPTASRP